MSSPIVTARFLAAESGFEIIEDDRHINPLVDIQVGGVIGNKFWVFKDATVHELLSGPSHTQWHIERFSLDQSDGMVKEEDREGCLNEFDGGVWLVRAARLSRSLGAMSERAYTLIASGFVVAFFAGLAILDHCDPPRPAPPSCLEGVLLPLAAPMPSSLSCAPGARLDMWDGVPVCLCPRAVPAGEPDHIPRPPPREP